MRFVSTNRLRWLQCFTAVSLLSAGLAQAVDIYGYFSADASAVDLAKAGKSIPHCDPQNVQNMYAELNRTIQSGDRAAAGLLGNALASRAASCAITLKNDPSAGAPVPLAYLAGAGLSATILSGTAANKEEIAERARTYLIYSDRNGWKAAKGALELLNKNTPPTLNSGTEKTPTVGVVQTVPHPGQFEKNGLPCVAEICIGDGIDELSRINWNAAKNPLSGAPIAKTPASAIDFVRLERQYKGNGVRAAAPYLSMSQFDSVALLSFARIDAACFFLYPLTGTFVSQGGNPTDVTIEMRADVNNSSKQRWTVLSIYREYPKAVSAEQRAEIEKGMTKRYKAFAVVSNPEKPWEPPPPMKADFSIGYRVAGLSPYGFGLRLRDQPDSQNRLRLHPACGGATKVNID